MLNARLTVYIQQFEEKRLLRPHGERFSRDFLMWLNGRRCSRLAIAAAWLIFGVGCLAIEMNSRRRRKRGGRHHLSGWNVQEVRILRAPRTGLFFVDRR